MMKKISNPKLLMSLGLVLIITWVVAFWYEGKLPDKIPSHWNIKGEIDGYMEKPWGVYMIPVISTLSSVLLLLLPMVAPKGFKLGGAKAIYDIVILIMAVFLLGIMVLMFEAGLDKDVDINQWVMAGTGLLFVFIGNYLSKVPKNFFLGIRTPWTLSSDEVWYKTHRLGSWTFVLAGLLALLGSSLHWPMGIMIAGFMVAALIPVIYSLVVYKQSEGFDE